MSVFAVCLRLSVTAPDYQTPCSETDGVRGRVQEMTAIMSNVPFAVVSSAVMDMGNQGLSKVSLSKPLHIHARIPSSSRDDQRLERDMKGLRGLSKQPLTQASRRSSICRNSCPRAERFTELCRDRFYSHVSERSCPLK
ncbi:hypothetical protein EYF80_023212 [Liparis tanakae]|uniref:Uncharacterized protein n=1 Tax=Liparis tanakae TaxID=230148 RepID=A0A4Z2HL44_9TELE|nr:hypothetical protein EYF80_023212 [Liparis tanakae]